MDQATLVNVDLERGQQIVERLDGQGLGPKIALWMTTPDYPDGRLVLASPKLDQTTTLVAYEKLHKALQGAPGIRTPPMLVLRMRDSFIRALRELFGAAADVSGMRLGGQTIGDRFVSDAFVYRIK